MSNRRRRALDAHTMTTGTGRKRGQEPVPTTGGHCVAASDPPLTWVDGFWADRNTWRPYTPEDRYLGPATDMDRPPAELPVWVDGHWTDHDTWVIDDPPYWGPAGAQDRPPAP